MKILITITYQARSYNYLVDDNLVIKQALSLIQANDNWLESISSNYLYSQKLHEYITSNQSFKTVGITAGDQLIIGGNCNDQTNQ